MTNDAMRNVQADLAAMGAATEESLAREIAALSPSGLDGNDSELRQFAHDLRESMAGMTIRPDLASILAGNLEQALDHGMDKASELGSFSTGLIDGSDEIWQVDVPDVFTGTEPYILQIRLADITRIVRRNNRNSTSKTATSASGSRANTGSRSTTSCSSTIPTCRSSCPHPSSSRGASTDDDEGVHAVTEQGSVRDIRDVPVACQADVVVAGGGSAGVTAAIAAARMGARTVLLERNFCLGGMMTAGLMSSVGMSRLHGGIADEIMAALVRMGAAIRPGLQGDLPPSRRHGGGPIDPEQTKWLLDEMAVAAGVQVLLGSPVVAAVMDGTTISMAIIENKSGRQAIRGTTFVDATGDGDLACRAGARYEIGRAEDGLCSASTLMFMVNNVDVGKVVAHFERNPADYGSVFDGKATALSPWARLKEALSNSETQPAHFAFSASFVERVIASGQFSEWEQTVLTQRPMAFLTQPGARDRLLVNATRNPRIVATDGRELSDAVIEGRRQARFLHTFMMKHLPGFERSYICETAAQLGVRESRRITGEYVFTEQDLVGHAKFGDVIARNDAHIEVHNPGKGFSLVWPDRDQGQFYEIPYRSIVAKDLENCLLAGRCYSATHLALAGSRNIGLCMAMGEAAGRAAAMAALGRIPIRQVPVGELQKLIGL